MQLLKYVLCWKEVTEFLSESERIQFIIDREIIDYTTYDFTDMAYE